MNQMLKKKIFAVICACSIIGTTVAYADDFSETVEFGARWNHGSYIDWGKKGSYSNLGKWGYHKIARASINEN